MYANKNCMKVIFEKYIQIKNHETINRFEFSKKVDSDTKWHLFTEACIVKFEKSATACNWQIFAREVLINMTTTFKPL